MGINIGDLQKVLLRNAPPSSANYVQRVGRAGGGKEKNSVCVTLCRRTKYDADAWNNPPRLMSEEHTAQIEKNLAKLREIHFASREALNACTASEGAQATIAHAESISTGGKPIFLVAEKETIAFGEATQAAA